MGPAGAKLVAGGVAGHWWNRLPCSVLRSKAASVGSVVDVLSRDIGGHTFAWRDDRPRNGLANMDYQQRGRDGSAASKRDPRAGKARRPCDLVCRPARGPR